MKKLFSFLMMAYAATNLLAYDFMVDDMYFNVTNDTLPPFTAEITRQQYGGDYSGDVIIPDSVVHNDTTFLVTRIGDHAFYDCSSLNSIAIPNTIESVGYGAFIYCRDIQSITLPNSIKVIDEIAFSECYSLKSINIPENVTSIGSGAFSDCISLECHIEIPGTMTSLETYVFSNTGIVSISIPNSIIRIGDGAFYGCSSLEEIELPNSIQSIGARAFEECNSLTHLALPKNVTNIGESICRSCMNLSNVVLPESLKVIPKEAFYECNALNSVYIPSNVELIDSAAFMYCTSLSSVDLPESLTTIKYSAFKASSALKNITLSNNISSIETDAFNGTKYYLNPFNWQSGVLYIGNYLIEASVIVAGKHIVRDDTKLIANNAFVNTLYLTSIVLPSSLTHIGDSAFYHCNTITSIEVQAIEPPAVGINAFGGIDRSIPVIVPEQSLEAYRQADVWKEFLSLQKDDISTDIEYSITPTKNTKFIRDGQLFILYHEHTFNTQGALVTKYEK